MAETPAEGTELTEARLLTIDAAAGGAVSIPTGFTLTTATFARDGLDLVITAADGTTLVVRDFFTLASPPDLMTPGGLEVTGAFAASLAGIEAPMFGTVHSLQGPVFIERATGERIEADIGDALYAGDTVGTGAGGRVGVTLGDGQLVSAGDDSRFRLVGPTTETGAEGVSGLEISVDEGTFTLFSRPLSEAPMSLVVRTPFGTVTGLEGQFGIGIETESALRVVLMTPAGDFYGSVRVANDFGVVTLDDPFEATRVALGGAPETPFTMPDADVIAAFEGPLLHVPLGLGDGNDYALQQAVGGGEIGEEVAVEGVPEVIKTVAGDYTVPTEPVAPATAPEPPATPARPASPITRIDEIATYNYAPVAFGEDVGTREDRPLTGALTAVDPDRDGITFGLVTDAGPAHGTVTLNADGTFTYVPEADFSGTDGFAYRVTDSFGAASEARVEINVTGVADQPLLTAADATGAVDAAIPITIAAEPADPSETITIVVSGVPEGAQLSAGTDLGDGTWTLTPDQLSGLTLTPPPGSSADFELQVTVTSLEPDSGDTASTSQTVAVVVTTPPGVPDLQVFDVSGAEDAAIPLSISVSVSGGEEIDRITISGLDDGTTLNLGHRASGGRWVITGDDLERLDELMLTPPEDSSADMTLSVVARSTSGDEAEATFSLGVTAVADQPTLTTVDQAYGEPGPQELTGSGQAETLVGGGGDDVLEGRGGDDVLYGDTPTAGAPFTVPLDIAAGLGDLDGSESLAVDIANVPMGATLSAGTDHGDGTWSMTADDLDGLSMTLSKDYVGDVHLNVTATATDIDPDTGDVSTASNESVLTIGIGGGPAGDDVLYGGAGDDVLYGGGGDDVLEGEGGADVLYGGEGDDALSGGGGEDVLYGGAGADALTGDRGDDILIGDAGDDVLTGGRGDDVLTGGEGGDAFIFTPRDGHDTVTDFEAGDVLRFEGSRFSPEDLNVDPDGGSTIISFDGINNLSVTLDDVDLTTQGYTVTQEPDAVVVTFTEEE